MPNHGLPAGAEDAEEAGWEKDAEARLRVAIIASGVLACRTSDLLAWLVNAIATGPGISSWMVPAEFEERDGFPSR